MKLYRKKPRVIEAMQFTDETRNQVFTWITSHTSATFGEDGKPTLKIQTLEGIMTASFGDYVIKGIQGEFYPCKEDIFEESYEPVGDE